MSTSDVPGYKKENCDELAMGCWAEHDDGSLILVEGNEGGRVIYSIFDTQPLPIVEYRDAMPEKGFKSQFSWKGKGDKWTWHDKTLFPWDRIIQHGASAGSKYASAEDLLTAAQRVAKSRDLKGNNFEEEDVKSRRDTLSDKIDAFVNKIQAAIDNLRD